MKVLVDSQIKILKVTITRRMKVMETLSRREINKIEEDEKLDKKYIGSCL